VAKGGDSIGVTTVELLGADVVAGEASGTVVDVVAGGPVGTTAHPGGSGDPAFRSAGTVVTVPPPTSSPTAVVPVSALDPVATNTTTPDTGAMESRTTPVDDTRWTESTPLPTATAIQPTGPPSDPPKDPESRSRDEPAAGTPSAGAVIEAVDTAWAFESSRVSVRHPMTPGRTVPACPGPTVALPVDAVPVDGVPDHVEEVDEPSGMGSAQGRSPPAGTGCPGYTLRPAGRSRRRRGRSHPKG
jgi:hypothetical protein